MDDPRELSRLPLMPALPLADPEPVTLDQVLAERDWISRNVPCHPSLVQIMVDVASSLQQRFGSVPVYRTSPRSQKILFNCLKVVAFAEHLLRDSPLMVHPDLLTQISEDFYLHRLGLPGDFDESEAREAVRQTVVEVIERAKLGSSSKK